ncbi:rlx protein [Lachnospiraceae bacterium MD308]|nr:rlx protein [Lachnospiraceae bacterium MD308]
MAILKHIASKNADYSEIQNYLIFQHDEYKNKPILDENGRLIPREEYYLDGINCDPFTFDMECKELNASYHKNRNYDEIKSHHYILSFDPKDTAERGLTGKRAQQLGLEFAKKIFPGHQTLVCTHMDGHNKSGNIHVHIVINSLRKYDVERQPFMERRCDSLAGYKHHLAKDYLIQMKQSVMDICQRENLYQVNLLSPAEKKITEQEYHAKRRGEKNLEKRNEQLRSEGLTPRKTEFQTQKEFLRSSIEKSALSARSLEEFQQILFEKYQIKLKVSRGRFSYLHPERSKFITGRMLGTHYETDYLLKQFEENAIQQTSPAHYSTSHGNDMQILFIKSDLHLVVNLQECIKAQQSAAYANKVKLSNLQEMAKTVAYIQEHGYDTRDSLEDSFAKLKNQASSSRKELKSIEDKLRATNEQIHYTGQYLANKSVYQQFCKSKNKGQFRKEHSAEIILYETARKFLKEHSTDGKLPSMKLLKTEKEQLLQNKKQAQKNYHYYRDYKKELYTVCSNVDTILGHPHSRQNEKQKKAEILK